jgi:2,4'-dihydroxyacetophenone dioxygenase
LLDTAGIVRRVTDTPVRTGPPPSALIGHVSDTDAPWVNVADGQRRMLHCDVANGFWVIGVRYEPGARVERHRHTGRVFAWTMSGCWMYREIGRRYEAGSYEFEPAGSVHTLVVPDDNTEVTEIFFVIEGANLILDEHDNIIRVNDAAAFRDRYLGLCAEQGKGTPTFIGA